MASSAMQCSSGAVAWFRMVHVLSSQVFTMILYPCMTARIGIGAVQSRRAALTCFNIETAVLFSPFGLSSVLPSLLFLCVHLFEDVKIAQVIIGVVHFMSAVVVMETITKAANFENDEVVQRLGAEMTKSCS